MTYIVGAAVNNCCCLQQTLANAVRLHSVPTFKCCTAVTYVWVKFLAVVYM
jgi:hypothetical protein